MKKALIETLVGKQFLFHCDELARLLVTICHKASFSGVYANSGCEPKYTQ
jgi:hypothetical protein